MGGVAPVRCGIRHVSDPALALNGSGLHQSEIDNLHSAIIIRHLPCLTI
jgi:hypothetical protein